MSIEAYIAIGLYCIMLLLIVANLRKGIRWKSIVGYCKAFVALFVGFFLVNIMLEYFDRPRYFNLIFSGWTYFFMFPLLIIYAYLLPLDKEFSPVQNLFRKDDPISRN